MSFKFTNIIFVLSMIFIIGCSSEHPADISDLFIVKKNPGQGLVSGLWYYCEQRHLEPLIGHTSVTIADLEGPGVIRLIRMSQLGLTLSDDMPRGIVLKIYYDNAEIPAVHVPVADFFADGCNGKSKYFCSNLFEKVPEAYNCYIPMPFKKRVRIVLCNETDHYFGGYTAIEWERLPKWNVDYGYFYATFTRKIFRLVPETKIKFFEVEGKGHFIGRQLSVVSAEPLYAGNLGWIMEGNNYFDLDGSKKQFNYLGTEDAFGFSHGFVEPWVGPHGGITHVEQGYTTDADTAQLSIFRLHDHMPIRFDKSLSWTINWQYETMFANPPYWRDKIGENGGWVDYAIVTYWYMDSPNGFNHELLRPLSSRRKLLLPPTEDSLVFRFPVPDIEPIVQKVFRNLDVDDELTNKISTKKDMNRITIIGSYPKTHPFFIDKPKKAIWTPGDNGHIGQPNPGRTGIAAVHPQDLETPCLLIRKVKIPQNQTSFLRVVVSGDPYGPTGPRWEGQNDFVLRVGVCNGNSIDWLDKRFVEPGDEPSPENWHRFDYNMDKYRGEVVAIVAEVSAGGKNNHWFNEEAFFDELSIIYE